MQIWTLSDAKQDLIGFTLVAQYSRDVCYYNFCVCVCVYVCACAFACEYIYQLI